MDIRTVACLNSGLLSWPRGGILALNNIAKFPIPCVSVISQF